MQFEPKTRVSNRLASLEEYEHNKPDTRLSFDSIKDAVYSCQDVSDSLNYTWNPLENGFANDKFYDYVDEYIKDPAETKLLFRAANISKKYAETFIQILQSDDSNNIEDNSNKSINRARLKEIILEFLSENDYLIDDFNIDSNFYDKESIFNIVTEFLDFYRSRVFGIGSFGEIIGDCEDDENYILIDEAKEDFVKSLDILFAQELLNADQLERAKFIARNLDIYITDPLTEVLFIGPETEENALGYFLPEDRTVYINIELIRDSIDRSYADLDNEKKKSATVIEIRKVVFHELIHTISNSWFSVKSSDSTIETDSGEETEHQDNYETHSIFPRFMREALTEMITAELYKEIYGPEEKRYLGTPYPGERSVVKSIIKKFDWDAAGISSKQAFYLLKKAFLDSASNLSTTTRPVESYIELNKALNAASYPGVLTRLSVIDEQLGIGTLKYILDSENFDPHELLKFNGLVSRDLLKKLVYLSSRKVGEENPFPEFLKEQNETANYLRQRKLLGRKILSIYTKTKKYADQEIHEKYIPGDDSLSPEQRLLNLIFGEKDPRQIILTDDEIAERERLYNDLSVAIEELKTPKSIALKSNN